MLTQTTAIARLLVKAPRLTPAGVCLWCEARDCQDPACDAQRALSVWAVCEDCDGLGWREDGDRCCFLGIEEITPAALTADELAAYRADMTADVLPTPVSVPPATVSAPLPRCLGCGHRTATAHPGCWDNIGTQWTPCGRCFGRRVGADGCECQSCDGVGFINTLTSDTLAERAGDLHW
jgi:hypothetical protein